MNNTYTSRGRGDSTLIQTTKQHVIGGSVKSIKGRVIGGYGVRFGNQNELDREGDFFAPDTDFMLDVYRTQPIFIEHTFAEDSDEFEDPRSVKIGKVISIRPDDVGLWIEAELDDSADVDDVLARIAKGKMHWSSGSVGHLSRREDDGKLSVWPIIEFSVTSNPAEVRDTYVTIVKSASGVVSVVDGTQMPNNTLDNVSEQDPKTKILLNEKVFKMASLLAIKLPDAVQTTFKKLLHESGVIKNVGDVRDKYSEKADGMAEDEFTKMDGEITSLLQPYAESIAALIGIPVERAMAAIMDLVTIELANPVSEESAPEGEYVEDVTAMLDEEEVVRSQDREEMKKKNYPNFDNGQRSNGYSAPNVHKSKPKPLGLAEYIRAARDKDVTTLRKHQPHTLKAYKAMGINPDTAGGFAVPVEQSNQLIELLRENAVMSGIVTEVPMNSDRLEIPKATGGVTVNWTGENSQITDSEATFGQVVLVAKKMTALVKLSNELINDSNPDVDAFIRADIARAMAIEFDKAVLYGAGTGNVPRGLYYTSGISNSVLSAATYDSLLGVPRAVEEANVLKDNTWRWVINPAIREIWQKQVDADGARIWSGGGYGTVGAGALPPDYQGYQYTVSNLTNPSSAIGNTLYFGRWADCVVGMRQSMAILASNEAGTSFEYDQTWVRAILRMDVVVRHEESFQIRSGITTAS